jgi:hypothetical protein
MRDYSKAAPTFWTGETGRKIRSAGRDTQVVAFYLFTCPNSNWIGLYYLPLPTLCHEVGISTQGALKALRSLAEIDFAYYDEGAEIVWVPGAAKYQVGESLKAGDNRIKGIVKDLQQYAKSAFCMDFYDRYAALYHLPMIEMPPEPLASPLQAPSKPVIEIGAVIGVGAEVGAGTCAQSDEKQSLSARSPAVPVFLKIPLIDKTEFEVLQCQVDEWKGLYLAVDVEQELRNYLGWTISHPRQRKTRDGILKSIDHWLRDEQNKGGKANAIGSGNSQGRRAVSSGPEFDPGKLDDWARK